MNKSIFHHNSRSGLTRTHLIVGVVVILALVAVFIPLLAGNNREKSAIQSSRNLQQWGIALNLYLIENKNLMPEAGAPTVSVDLPKAWYNGLPIYLGRSPLAQMQPDERPTPKTPSLWMDPSAEGSPVGNGYYFSYAMNRYLNPNPKFPTFKILDIRDPGQTIFLTEVSQSNPGALPADVVYRYGTHSEPKAHVLFCDGHVELVDQKAVNSNVPGETKSAATPEPQDKRPVFWEPSPGSPSPVPLKNGQ